MSHKHNALPKMMAGQPTWTTTTAGTASSQEMLQLTKARPKTSAATKYMTGFITGITSNESPKRDLEWAHELEPQ